MFAVVLTLMTGVVEAQEVMTLDKCRRLAMENNKSNAIAAKNEEKAGYLRLAYFANYFPKISASANYLYSNTQLNRTIAGGYLPTFVPDPATGELKPNILAMSPDGSPIFKEYAYSPDMNLSLKLGGTWTAGLSVEQPVYAGGKIRAAYRMTQTAETIARLNSQYTGTEIIVRTDEAYWTCIQMNELVKLAESYQTMLVELLRNVSAAQSAGLKHRNDVLKVQVKANEAELQLLKAENALRLSKKNLCHITGISSDVELVFPESFDALDDEVSYGGTFDARPEYAILSQQITLKQQQIDLTRSDFLPRVGIVANYGYMNGMKLNGTKLLNRASLSVIASVSVPLFQWGEGKNKIRAARTDLEIVRLERDDVGERMELEISRAIDKCVESAAEVKLTERSLQQSAENMKISSDQYREGMETLSDYLESQAVWQRAYMEHIDALTRQYLNRTYFLKATGKLGER
jgi:outer membrane protein TolC